MRFHELDKGWIVSSLNLQMVEIDIIQPEHDEQRCHDGRGHCI